MMTPCHHDGHGDHQYGDPFGLSTHATLSLHVSLQRASVVGRQIPYLIHEPLRAWLGEWLAPEAVTPGLPMSDILQKRSSVLPAERL